VKVSVALRGFSRQNAVSAEDVAATVRRLPFAHLEDLREIIYSPGEPLRYPSLGAASAAAGCAEYVQSQRTIFIYTTHDLPLFWHVLHHEIGHHVFFLRVGAALKKEWVSWLYPGSECATAYGYASAAEDFAECYALFARRPEALGELPEKLAFMREVFAGGRGSLREAAAPTR
jgi:hypothetical protein